MDTTGVQNTLFKTFSSTLLELWIPHKYLVKLYLLLTLVEQELLFTRVGPIF